MRITNAIVNLRQQIHDDLRRQHPEWVLPSGDCPLCDVYEARLMDLLGLNALDAKVQTFKRRTAPLKKGRAKYWKKKS